MARYYTSRRRRRRSRYLRIGTPRLTRYIVIIVIAVALVLMLRRDRGSAADPNVPDEAMIQENLQVSSPPEPIDESEVRSAMALPEAASSEPNVTPSAALTQSEPDVVQNNPEVQAVVTRAMAMLANDPGKVIEVRDTLNGLLGKPMSTMQRTGIKDELTKLSERWLFSNTVYAGDPLCDTYLVKKGQRLERICRNYDVPYQILMKINQIRRAKDLRAGVRIKVVNGPFHVEVNRSTMTMDLYLNNTFVKSYLVGLGQSGRETPIGEWRVTQRLIKPDWRHPDTGELYKPSHPDYPLGSHYIEIEGVEGEALGREGFAIHGTDKPQEIGLKTSLGCIRMRNADVEEVYSMLVEGMSRVRVVK